MTISIQDIRQAASAIAGSVVKTPCTLSQTLSEITGAQIVLKFENHQFTASFKDRGALVKLLSLSTQQRQAGVIAMSAGNHAQAVAYHAQRLGITATIIMPRHTPNVKVERTRAFGADVLLHGEGLDEARDFALKLAEDNGFELIHPYDDKEIIVGQGTIAIEMLEAFPDLEVIVIPIGGGGLIAGNAIAAKAIAPDIDIVGVESARFPSMHQALGGQPIRCGATSMAEGIAVKEPGSLTLPIVREHVAETFIVQESQIESAVLLLLEVEKTVVEGAGAVGLAVVMENQNRFKNRKVGVILSGGNIDLLTLSSIIQRGLVRSGRLVRFRVGIPDIPGALAKVTGLLGKMNANIVDISHQRAFSHLSLRLAEVQFILQTLGEDHVSHIKETLAGEGYQVSLTDGNG